METGNRVMRLDRWRHLHNWVKEHPASLQQLSRLFRLDFETEKITVVMSGISTIICRYILLSKLIIYYSYSLYNSRQVTDVMHPLNFRKKVFPDNFHRLDLLDRGVFVPDGLVGECRRRHSSHTTGSDGPDVPRSRHQHTGSYHERNRGAEGVRRYGRLEFRWQQHLRRDRWVSIKIFQTSRVNVASSCNILRMKAYSILFRKIPKFQFTKFHNFASNNIYYNIDIISFLLNLCYFVLVNCANILQSFNLLCFLFCFICVCIIV